MYKLTQHNSITRLADSASIPKDERNRDYQEFLKWQAEGGVPAPADPLPAPVDPDDLDSHPGLARLARAFAAVSTTPVAAIKAAFRNAK